MREYLLVALNIPAILGMRLREGRGSGAAGRRGEVNKGTGSPLTSPHSRPMRRGNLRCLLRASLICLLPVAPVLVAAGEVRSTRDFEASAFAKQHKPLRTSSWPLKTDGTSASYAYVDFDSDSSCSVDFTLKGETIEKFTVSWHGESRRQPARLTTRREAFLRELLASMKSRADAGAVVAYVKANQQLRYPDGVATAPERLIGGLNVKAGVTGSSLLVVLRF